LPSTEALFRLQPGAAQQGGGKWKRARPRFCSRVWHRALGGVRGGLDQGRRHDPQDGVYQQPTLDTEAQQLAEGDPDSWLFVDFCATFQKLALPLSRTGKWDPARSFGSDTLNDCSHRGAQNWPGMRATRADASSPTGHPTRSS